MNMLCRWWLAVLAFSIGVLLLGCGGGGGGSTSTTGTAGGGLTAGCPVGTQAGTLNYSTAWGSSSGSSSQVIQLLDGTGTVIATDSLNRGAGATSGIALNSITPGVYELRVRHYSGPNATGTLVRTASSVVDLCTTRATVSVNTTYDSPPIKVEVGPGGQSVVQNTTAQHVATALAGDGSVVLVGQNAFSWDVQGAVGTVSSSGLFTATTPGPGAIRAILNNPVLVGSAPVTVTATTTTTSKWTVLVYINAANDLFSASDLNVNQMEKVASNPDVRFVLQWKQSRDIYPSSSFDGVRRYLVKPDTTNAVVSQLLQANLRDNQGNPLDMGNPQTLRDFVDWGKANFPAERYCLVIWNHGNGWRRSVDNGPTRAFSYDDSYGTSIQLWEADAALAGHKFDILAWDCSLMQMLECAYEFRNIADYIVGSEESPPAEGYPYDLVFAKFRDNPTDTTRNLTKAFVDGMLTNPPYGNRKITQSSIESAKLADVATALDGLATALIANQGTLGTIIPQVRADSQSYSPTSQRVYRDLVHLCELLEASPGVPATVVSASQNVRAAVSAALAWEGHNLQSPNSRGLSIDFSGSATFGPSAADYLQLKLSQNTMWNEWLAIAP